MPRRICHDLQAIAVWLAEGKSYNEIAALVGAQKETIRKKAGHPEVKRMERAHRNQLLRQGFGIGCRSCRDAMETLIEYMSPGPAASPGSGTAVRAAEAVLDQTRKALELDIADRLQELEDRQTALEARERERAARGAADLDTVLEP